MRVILFEEFEAEIKKVREYLTHLSKISDAIDENQDATILPRLPKADDMANHFISVRKDLKRFEYNAIIITLYGILESTINRWVEAFLTDLNSTITYSNLPKTIQKNHFDNSLSLIKIAENPSYSQYESIQKNTILKNLYDCSIDHQTYKLNTESFTIRSSNVKHQRIAEILTTIGIDFNNFLGHKYQALIKSIDTLVSEQNAIAQSNTTTQLEDIALIQKKIDTIRDYGHKYQALIESIDTLVIERNAIAHGNTTLQLRDMTLINKEIDNIKDYGQLIFDVLKINFTTFTSSISWLNIEIIGIYDKKILVFEIENYELCIGDILLVIKGDGSRHELPIVAIHLGDKTSDIINTNHKVTTLAKIGIKVDKHIHDNQKFYLIKK